MQRAEPTPSISLPASSGGKSTSSTGASRRATLGAMLIAPIAAVVALPPAAWAASTEWDRHMSGYRMARLHYRAAWDAAAAAELGPHQRFEDEADRRFGEMSDHLDALVKLPAPTFRAYAERLELALVDGEMVDWHGAYLVADARRLGGLA